MTSLRYQGNTGALNRFLSGLANCLDVTMQVSFTGELDQDTDWRVFHEPPANRFHIEIDYQSERIKLAELILPEIAKPSVGIH
ncbi:MAG: hypothetical protein ACKJSK_05475 [Roseibacillus sp.]